MPSVTGSRVAPPSMCTFSEALRQRCGFAADATEQKSWVGPGGCRQIAVRDVLEQPLGLN